MSLLIKQNFKSDRYFSSRPITTQVELLMAKNTEGRFLSIFGEPGVNVLKLNLALDNLNRS